MASENEFKQAMLKVSKPALKAKMTQVFDRLESQRQCNNVRSILPDLVLCEGCPFRKGCQKL